MSYANLLEDGLIAQKYLPISYGQATLVSAAGASSVAVALPAAAAADVILVQHTGATAATDGVLTVDITPGTGFTIASTNGLDVGVVRWVRFAL
jgi:hypothetical protein